MTRRALSTAVRTAFHRSAIDGGGMVVAIAFYVVIVATLSGLWRVAVDANGGDLAGYSAVALTWYIITSEAAIVSVNARAHRGDRHRHRAGHRRGRDAPPRVGDRRPDGDAGRPRPAAGRGALGRRWGGGDDRRRRTAAPVDARAGGAEPRARDHRQPLRAARRRRQRLLDPRRRLHLVPLHEGGVHPRRDDHPARAAARRARGLRRAAALPGDGVRAGAARVGLLGAVAPRRAGGVDRRARRRGRRRLPLAANGDSRWWAGERASGRRAATPSPRWPPSRERSASRC